MLPPSQPQGERHGNQGEGEQCQGGGGGIAQRVGAAVRRRSKHGLLVQACQCEKGIGIDQLPADKAVAPVFKQDIAVQLGAAAGSDDVKRQDRRRRVGILFVVVFVFCVFVVFFV